MWEILIIVVLLIITIGLTFYVKVLWNTIGWYKSLFKKTQKQLQDTAPLRQQRMQRYRDTITELAERVRQYKKQVQSLKDSNKELRKRLKNMRKKK